MIGKIATGKSFRGCLQYLHDGRQRETIELQRLERDSKQTQVIYYNLCFGSKKELIQQFNEVKLLNQKVSKPVFHASLSLAHADAGKLNQQDKADIAAVLAKDFGFSNNQYVVVSHGDTQHEHLHIVANRIGYDGKTASDSNSYKRMANFCRKIEIDYNLARVLSPNRFLKPEQRDLQVKRLDQRKELLKQHLRQAIKSCPDIHQVRRYMEVKGYQVELARGIAFTDPQMVRFKGSQVGYALAEIEKQLRRQHLHHPKELTNQNNQFKQSKGISI